jgi:hypothetical protein
VRRLDDQAHPVDDLGLLVDLVLEAKLGVEDLGEASAADWGVAVGLRESGARTSSVKLARYGKSEERARASACSSLSGAPACTCSWRVSTVAPCRSARAVRKMRMLVRKTQCDAKRNRHPLPTSCYIFLM